MSQFSGWITARRSYAFVLANAREAFVVGAIWVVVLTAFRPVFFAIVGAFPTGSIDYGQLGWFFFITENLVFALAYAATAVAWHRLVLQQRRPSFIPAMSFATVIYLSCLVALFVVVWLSPFIGMAIFVSTPSSFSALTAVPMVIAFLLLALVMRFALKLPAIAIDDRTMTFAEAWRRGRPLWPGLVWGAIVAYAPAFILAQMTSWLTYDLYLGSVVASTVMTVLYCAFTLIGMMLFATFLSLSYQFVVGDKGVGEVFA